MQANHPIWKLIKEFAELIGKAHKQAKQEAQEDERQRKKWWSRRQKELKKALNSLTTSERIKQEQLNAEEDKKFKQKETRSKAEEARLRTKKLQELTTSLEEKLLPVLESFDQGLMYSPDEKDDEKKWLPLLTYNICGDKALHMCMLTAYKYPEKSLERNALKVVVKKLIHRFGDSGAANMVQTPGRNGTKPPVR